MSALLFGPYRFDPSNARLSRDGVTIPLTPRAFSLLSCLIGNPQRLMSKEELLDAVWANRCVTEAVLKVCVRELRKALEDTARTPQYIETVHSRGYRFIGRTRCAMETQAFPVTTANPAPGLDPLGRHLEVSQLVEHLVAARRGQRQIVFLVGEQGSGKTLLVTNFLAEIVKPLGIAVGRGQCFERLGTHEPYLPWFESISQLCRDTGAERFSGLVRRCAPTWLARMPWLHDGKPPEIPRPAPSGTGRCLPLEKRSARPIYLLGLSGRLLATQRRDTHRPFPSVPASR